MKMEEDDHGHTTVQLSNQPKPLPGDGGPGGSDEGDAQRPENDVIRPRPPTWLTLESSPEAMNKLSHNLGLRKNTLQFCDVYGFDKELLAFVPQPVRAVMLLFPSELQPTIHKSRRQKHLAQGDAVTSTTTAAPLTAAGAPPSADEHNLDDADQVGDDTESSDVGLSATTSSSSQRSGSHHRKSKRTKKNGDSGSHTKRKGKTRKKQSHRKKDEEEKKEVATGESPASATTEDPQTTSQARPAVPPVEKANRAIGDPVPSHPLCFISQMVDGCCGTIAVSHCIANNIPNEVVSLHKRSVLRRFLSGTKAKVPVDRGWDFAYHDGMNRMTNDVCISAMQPPPPTFGGVLMVKDTNSLFPRWKRRYFYLCGSYLYIGRSLEEVVKYSKYTLERIKVAEEKRRKEMEDLRLDDDDADASDDDEGNTASGGGDGIGIGDADNGGEGETEKENESRGGEGGGGGRHYRDNVIYATRGFMPFHALCPSNGGGGVAGGNDGGGSGLTGFVDGVLGGVGIRVDLTRLYRLLCTSNRDRMEITMNTTTLLLRPTRDYLDEHGVVNEDGSVTPEQPRDRSGGGGSNPDADDDGGVPKKFTAKARENVKKAHVMECWYRYLVTAMRYWKSFRDAYPYPDDVLYRQAQEVKRRAMIEKARRKNHSSTSRRGAHISHPTVAPPSSASRGEVLGGPRDIEKQRQREEEYKRKQQQKDQASLPQPKERVCGNHYICFLPIKCTNGETCIVELDGLQKKPVFHTATTQESFLEDCVSLIQKEYVNACQTARQQLAFNVMAFVPVQPLDGSASAREE